MTRTTKKRIWMLAVVSLVLLGATLGNAQTAQEIARTALGSTVFLTVEDESGEPVRYRSGFLVHDGEIVTNFHVVEGATGGYANLVSQTTKYTLQGVVAVDRERDLVVLKIAPSGTPVLRIGDSDTVQVGDPVYAVGNPLGLEGTFSQGVVSGVRQFDNQELFQITAPISPGSSGGPVLDVNGDVIGIAVATVQDGQNLNFAIPANYLTKLLQSSRSSKPLAVSPDDTRALLSLGSKYYHGQGVTQSYEEAARLFRLAAEQGNAEAQELLGRMYYWGSGVTGDKAEAARWYRLAAEQGRAESQRWLGYMYEWGIGLPEDLEEASRWYRMAAEQGHVEAQYSLGFMSDDHAESEKWLGLAGGQGDVRAQSLLGFRYWTRKDYAEAARWYRMAAEQGHTTSQYALGDAYYYGRGVTQDYREAARWYGLAADQGHSFAQSALGAMYYRGEGVPQDYSEAAKWLRSASAVDYDYNLGYPNAYAQRFLGILYYYGKGVPQDYSEAAKWFRLVAEIPSVLKELNTEIIASSQRFLGMMYYDGDGVPQDYAEASRWFRPAAEQGDSFAQLKLGYMYSRGSGVPQDHAEAARWFRLGAEQGYTLAQRSLASAYRYGVGVPKDTVAAHAWLNVAAAQGDDDAAADRDDLARHMTTNQTASAQRLARELWNRIYGDAAQHSPTQ